MSTFCPALCFKTCERPSFCQWQCPVCGGKELCVVTTHSGGWVQCLTVTDLLVQTCAQDSLSRTQTPLWKRPMCVALRGAWRQGHHGFGAEGPFVTFPPR